MSTKVIVILWPPTNVVNSSPNWYPIPALVVTALVILFCKLLSTPTAKITDDVPVEPPNVALNVEDSATIAPTWVRVTEETVPPVPTIIVAASPVLRAIFEYVPAVAPVYSVSINKFAVVLNLSPTETTKLADAPVPSPFCEVSVRLGYEPVGAVIV